MFLILSFISGETEGNSTSTNGVLKALDDTKSNEQLESATQEIREMLETLKRGIKLEKDKLPTYSKSPTVVSQH